MGDKKIKEKTINKSRKQKGGANPSKRNQGDKSATEIILEPAIKRINDAIKEQLQLLKNIPHNNTINVENVKNNLKISQETLESIDDKIKTGSNEVETGFIENAFTKMTRS